MNLNKNQRIVIGVGLGVFVFAAFLVVPYSRVAPVGTTVDTDVGTLWNPPKYMTIRGAAYVGQLVAVVVLTTGVVLLLKDTGEG